MMFSLSASASASASSSSSCHRFLCLLITAISISILSFLHLKLNNGNWDIKTESGDGEFGVRLLHKFRVILGMEEPIAAPQRQDGSSSPSPAPAPGPTHFLRLHGHLHFQPHSLHIKHTPPLFHGAEENFVPDNKERDSKPRGLVVEAATACAGATLAIFAVVAFLAIRRIRRQSKRSSQKLHVSKLLRSETKIRANLDQEVFYLNSLASYVGTNHSGRREAIQNTENVVFFNNAEAESNRDSNSGFVEEETKLCNNTIRSPSSSDTESFHTICNSHCSSLRSSSFSELILGNPESPSRSPASVSTEIFKRVKCYGSISLPPPPPILPPRPPAFLKPSSANNTYCVSAPPPPPPSPPVVRLSTSRNVKNSGDQIPPRSLQQPLEQMIEPGREDTTTLPKLKPLHWDKVRATPDRSMVWDKIQSSSFKLNEEMIESLFAYNMQKCAKKEEFKSKSSSPSSSKQILEHQRLQNITIIQKALNASPDDIREALLQGRGLSMEQLEALVKMAPTKEEEEKISNFKGNIDEFIPAEKFIHNLLAVPFVFRRAEALLYKEAFDDEVAHLKNSFATLEEACHELKSSQLFLRLLEAVLRTGNRMNIGTTRGDARAFKLDALLKLADVKAADKKTTLLHFVLQEIIRSDGGASELSDNKAEETQEEFSKTGMELISELCFELLNVKKAANMDISVIKTSVLNLSDGLTQIEQLVEKDLRREGGGFVNFMKSFVVRAQTAVQELKDEEEGALLRVREITEYFHGDASKEEGNPLRIFVIVKEFLAVLDRECRELRCLKPKPVILFR